MSAVRFNGTVVAVRNALKLHKYRNAAYVYQWSDEDDKYLPEHYKQRCEDFMRKIPEPVHYKQPKTRWRMYHQKNIRVRDQDGPIEVTYPEECNYGLWGGEGIVLALYKTNWRRHNQLLPKMWRPNLFRRVLYSEILDKWYNIVVTLRTLELIDNSYGFDFYILQTHERDLNSRLGMKLKREMLLALAKKDMYPDDPEKREKIYNRYKKFLIPEEEAEWVGLSMEEALQKGKNLYQEKNRPVPMKYHLTKIMLEKLENKDKTPEDTQSQDDIFEINKVKPGESVIEKFSEMWRKRKEKK